MSVLIDEPITSAATTSERSERDAKLDALRERLDAAVGALVTGEDWLRAITFAARFRSRSFSNSLLIWAQHLAAYEAGQTTAPEPTFVAGFKQWKALGRHVMKGKRGYQIMAPVTRLHAVGADGEVRRLDRGEKPGPGERVESRMVGCRVAYVWDVSATEGEPLPEMLGPIPLLQGQAPAGLGEGLADHIGALGYSLGWATSAGELGGANGVTNYTDRSVTVRQDMEEAAIVKTMAHELAHCLQEADPADGGRLALHKGIREVEAESVAAMVAAAHGMDTTSFSVPYVTGWATAVPGREPLDVVRSTADRVRAMAVQILDRLDTRQTPAGAPPAPAEA